MKRLTVVILNYRTPAMTIACLQSLVDEVSHQDSWHVVVVDNCSNDNSVAQIQSAIDSNHWGRWARVVAAEQNAGFAAGNNEGIRAQSSDAYLLLNSDTLVRPGAISVLLDAMEAEDRIGLIGPRLEWPDAQPQVSCFRNRSPLGELVGAAGFSVLDRLFPRAVVAIPVSDEAMEPEWVSFACVLIREKVIADIGHLDDGFFMYFEDIDFARRARRAGWKVRYEPAARVVHLRGGSSLVKESKARRDRVPRYYYASRSRYFAKWYGGRLGIMLANTCWMGGRFVSWLMELLRRREPFHCAHEGRDNWINWLNPYRKPAALEGGDRT